MTDSTNNNRPELRFHDDPLIAQTESMLDALAQADRDAMPSGLESRVLDAISAAMAPAPISMGYPARRDASTGLWSLRLAAAAVLAMGTTLLIVGTHPWTLNQGAGGGASPHQIALTSLEQDLDAYMSLESVDDGNLSEAVTDWEIWAQSVDTDFDSQLVGLDLFGATHEDGAL